MIACVDVGYNGDEATAACVMFRSWGDGDAVSELVEKVTCRFLFSPDIFYQRNGTICLTFLE